MEPRRSDTPQHMAELLAEQARAHLTQNRPAEALPLIQKSLILQPTHPDWHKLQGEIYLAMGKADLARAKFKRAMQLEPLDEEAKRFFDELAGGASSTTAPPAATGPLPVLADPGLPALADMFLLPEEEEQVMEGALEVLTRLVQTEKLLKEQGIEGGEAFQLVNSLRRELAEQIRSTYRSRTGEEPQDELLKGDEARQGLTDLTLELQAMVPFRAVIGPAGRDRFTVSEGAEVANLQKLLLHKGYALSFTGVYDRDTANAIRQFQEQQGLPVNGIVGGEMRKALNAILTLLAATGKR